MSTKVSVNPGQIAIKDGSSFLVTASDGSIDDNLAQGSFVCDRSFHRGPTAAPDCASSTPRYANGRLFFDVAITPGQSWLLPI